MKKYFKLFSVLFVLVMLTGCVKYDLSMKITNNKKMELVAIKADATGSQSYASDKSALEKKGFKVEDYKDNTYKGIKFSKTYNNIDKVSTDKDVTVSLNEFFDGKEPEFFFKKNGNKYSATYTFDLSGLSGTNSDPLEDPTDTTGTTTAEPPTVTIDGTDGTDTTDGTDDTDLDFDGTDKEIDESALESSMELQFTLEVPKVVSSNATKVDGNKLTWDLNKLNGQPITFEFEANGSAMDSNLILYGGIAAAVVVVLVVILLVVKKGKKTPATPVVAEAPAQPAPEVPTVPTEPVAEPAPAETPTEEAPKTE